MKARPIVRWDTCEIAEGQAEWLAEQYLEAVADDPDQAEDDLEGMDKDQLQEHFFDEACRDSDHYDFEWEYVVGELSETMRVRQTKKNREMEPWYWLVKGYGMGWQHREGYKFLEANNGQELLNGILPDTDCTWELYHWQNGFRLKNWHHDAPMGETYLIRPITELTYNRNRSY